VAVFFFFDFPRALDTFFNIPGLRAERIAGLLAAFLATGFFFAAGLAVLLEALFTVVLVVLFRAAVFPLFFLLTGLPAVLFFTGVLFLDAVLFLAAGLLFLAVAFLPAVAAGVRFFAVLVLFPAALPFFAAAAALLFFTAAVPLFAAAAVLLFLAVDVLFFTVDAVFPAAAVFLPAALRELLPLLLSPAELLVFGIVISLLSDFHSISVFLLIW
jgi:hypothetical protein